MATPLIDVQLGCQALPELTFVHEAHGEEGQNQITQWAVGLTAQQPLDPDALIGESITLALIDSLEGVERLFDLVVISVELEGESLGRHHARLELASPLWMLGLRETYRVFRDKTTREIVSEVLLAAGVAASSCVFRLSGPYEKRLYTVQYGESDLDFITRLLAEEGISYWFEVEEDEPRIVFNDDKAGYEEIVGLELPFKSIHGMAGGRAFYELSVTDSMATTSTFVRNDDVRQPDRFVEARAEKATEAGAGTFLEYFEYPAKVLTEEAAKARASARLEQLQRESRLVHARSDCVRVAPGRVVAIDGCFESFMNGNYVIAQVEHRITKSTTSVRHEGGYDQQCRLVPHGERPYRPALPKRVRQNAEPAFTTGTAGEEIHVDDLGRVKVRFPWDRSGVDDDTTSYWVRCLQPLLVSSMALPRVGWEVPVVYMDGDPDQPFVLGRHYNAEQVLPYGLPAGKTQTALQSATSPSDGTTNEIRMGDAAGSQELFIHASRDQTVTVGGNATSDVGSNETHDVGLSLLATTKGSQSSSIGADQTVNIGTNYNIAVGGSRTLLVGGMEAVEVTANRTMSVDASYTELIGAFYGIQCNQSNTGVKGAFLQMVGGTLSQTAGLGAAETVVASRIEMVGGSKSSTTLRGYSETITGFKRITTGSMTEKAGGKAASTASGTGTVNVGGALSLSASGDFVIEAPNITLDGAAIKSASFELAGGALKVKRGKATLRGSVKRSGPAKFG